MAPAISPARRPAERPARLLAFLGIASLAIWWGAIGHSLGFYTILNDFWGPFFIGDQLALDAPRSWHNGFFPIGYPLLLRALRSRQVLAIAWFMSVAAAAWLLAHLVLATSRLTHGWVATGLTLAAGLHPLVFQHAITAGPDMLAAALGTSGMLMLLGLGSDASGKGSFRRAALAGLLLGVAGLFRYHAFLFAGAALLSALLAWPHRWREVTTAAALAVAAGAVQVACNLFAGVGPLQTAQAFNVYKSFNTVDWFSLRKTYPDSVIDVIRLNPGAFAAAWWATLKPSLLLWSPTAVASLAARGARRRVALACAMTSLAYLAAQAVGGGPRGPLLAAPLAVVGLALIATAARERLAGRLGHVAAAAVPAATLAVAVVLWLPPDLHLVRRNHQIVSLWQSAESALRADGVRHAAQVFTDSFDFYFTSVRSPRSRDYRPRSTGGWAQIDLYGYERVHPPLRTSSLAEFLADCEGTGITHLALTPAAGLVQRDLGVIQAGGPLPFGLREVAMLPGIRIVALPPRLAPL